jgi:rod shape determining protein RodA
MTTFLAKFKHFDLPLLLVSGLLLIVGLALLYATSLSGDTLYVFYRQLLFAGIGLVLFLFFCFYNYHAVIKVNWAVYAVFIVVLLFVLLFGRQIRGSSRWIDFGFFRFQPAEFVKLVVIVALAHMLFLLRGQINHWRNILLTVFCMLAPALLVLFEPDLGSTIVIGFIWLGMLLISPIKKKYVLIVLVVLLCVAGLGWKFVLKDYQRQRVEVFLNPTLDPQGKGYNVRQAVIAVGSGRLFGRGLGQGLQSQLKFLPERQTDFMFASSSEEIGFVGSIALLILYYFLFRRLIYVMKNARDDAALYITGGVLCMLFVQVVVNVGMNIGLLPVTGIPLPLISYGGSSLLVVMISLGLVQNIARQSQALRF